MKVLQVGKWTGDDNLSSCHVLRPACLVSLVMWFAILNSVTEKTPDSSEIPLFP